MRILHFVESFSQPTETFIKRFVQKSNLFANVGIVAFNLHDIDAAIETEISLFEISGRLYTRKTIQGGARYSYERLTGRKLWYKQLNNIIETFKPDIIHCHFGNIGVMMMEFYGKFPGKVPFVTSFYGYDISSQPFLDKIYRKRLTKLWKSGNAFFAEGPELLKKAVALGSLERKCLVNPLLIPVQDYPSKSEYRSANDRVKFIFIGRFIEKKGFHVFLKAMGQLKEKIPSFSIDIVGAGPYREKYEQIIEKYNLQPSIKWLGMLKHEDIIKMLCEYDFLVHPSLTAADNDSEGGAPTIIIEAQAVGLPVITSDHADIPYVMGYHNFLSKENDLSSLVSAIEKIINCQNIQYYTNQGIAKIQYQHNLNRSDIYEKNLKQVIG